MPAANDIAGPDPATAVNSMARSETGYRIGSGPDAGADESTALLGGGASEGGAVWTGAEEYSHIPRWRRPSVFWLIAPYVLFTVAFGGSIVPRINMIIELVCRRYFSDRSDADPSFAFAPVVPGAENRQCQTPEVQRHVATFTMVLSLITGGLSALTVPKIGSLSDRYGRKRLIVVASAGGILNEIVLIFAAKYPESVHHYWLILGAAVDGIGGSFSAATVVGNSYISDCTPPSRRGVAIGYLYSCLYFGLAFGPVMAGYMVEKWTHELVSVFYVTLGCHIFFVLFILAVLPESVSRKRQLLARKKHAEAEAGAAAARQISANAGALGLHFGGDVNPDSRTLTTLVAGSWAAVKAPLAPLRMLNPRGAANAKLRRNLMSLAAIDTVLIGTALGLGQLVILYVELQFGWTNFQTSEFVSATSSVRVLVLVGVFPIVNYFFRVRRASAGPIGVVAQERNAGADGLDLWILRVAIASEVLGMTAFLLARSSPLFVFGGMINAIGGMGGAMTQSALTKHVAADRVGALLGAIGQLHALARLLFPLILSGLYAATVGFYPQAPFLLLTAVFAGILVLTFFVTPHVYAGSDADEVPAYSQSEEVHADLLASDEVLPVQ